MSDPLNIVWKGRKPFSDISFGIETPSFQLPENLYEERDRIWSFLNYFDPNQYNGDLFLCSIWPYQSREFPTIRIQPISYRNFKTLQFAHRNFPPVDTDYEQEIDNASIYTRSGPDEEIHRSDIFDNYSVLCCVYLITNPDRTHVLVGTRGEIGGWGDGFFACPGGIIEWSGIQGMRVLLDKIQGNIAVTPTTDMIENLLLSELYEEVEIEFQIDNTDIVGILDARNGMFANLIIEVSLHTSEIMGNIRANHEFVDRKLHWMAISEIKNQPDDQLFGGLRFIKYSGLY